MVEVNSFVRLGPAFTFFLVFSLLGVVIIVVSGGLLGVYVGFECAFLGIVAVLAGESVEENESCIKYYIFQALGSIYMLVGFVSLVEPVISLYWSWGFVILGVCLKAGFFPFHYWVPSVLATCSWFSCFLVTVWQNVGLMCFIGKWGVSYELTWFLEVIACATALLGGVGGIGVVFYRTLIGYSSLVHSGWIILASLLGVYGVMFYIFVYSMVSGSLMYRLYCSNVMCFEDFSNLNHRGSEQFFLIFVDFLSLAGIPTLPGFLPNLVVLVMVGMTYPLSLFLLIFSSLLSLFYYLNVALIAGVGSGVNGYLFVSSMNKPYCWLLNTLFRWNSFFYLISLVGLAAIVFYQFSL